MKKAKVKLKALMDEDSDENSDFEKELAKGKRVIKIFILLISLVRKILVPCESS